MHNFWAAVGGKLITQIHESNDASIILHIGYDLKSKAAVNWKNIGSAY